MLPLRLAHHQSDPRYIRVAAEATCVSTSSAADAEIGPGDNKASQNQEKAAEKSVGGAQAASQTRSGVEALRREVEALESALEALGTSASTREALATLGTTEDLVAAQGPTVTTQAADVNGSGAVSIAGEAAQPTPATLPESTSSGRTVVDCRPKDASQLVTQAKLDAFFKPRASKPANVTVVDCRPKDASQLVTQAKLDAFFKPRAPKFRAAETPAAAQQPLPPPPPVGGTSCSDAALEDLRSAEEPEIGPSAQVPVGEHPGLPEEATGFVPPKDPVQNSQGVSSSFSTGVEVATDINSGISGDKASFGGESGGGGGGGGDSSGRDASEESDGSERSDGSDGGGRGVSRRLPSSMMPYAGAHRGTFEVGHTARLSEYHVVLLPLQLRWLILLDACFFW